MFLLGLIGEVIGTALGGYLGQVLAILPFLVRSLLLLLGVVPLLLIPEHLVTVAHHNKRHPVRHLLQGLQSVWQNPVVLGLILISGLTTSCWQTVYFYYQLYLHGIGVALAMIGLIVALSTITNCVFTALAPWLMGRLPIRTLIAIFCGCEIAGLALMSMASTLLSLCGYLIFFQASISVLAPAISTYINERCPEAQRATVLSLETGMFSAAMIILFPLFGLGVSRASYRTVYGWTLVALVLGVLFTCGLVWGISAYRRWRQRQA